MSQLDELIEQCDELLSGEFIQSKADNIAASYSLAYMKETLSETGNQMDVIAGPIDRPMINSIRLLLASHRDRMNHELAVAQATAGSTSVNTSLSVNVSVTLSQTVESLEKCSLSPEELTEIKAALLDLEASKTDEPQTVCDKASKVLDLVKKGADAAAAVAPFVAAALSAIR